MVLISVDFHSADNLLNLAVNADVEIALLSHLLEELAIVTLTVAYERCEDENLLTRIVVLNHADNFLFGVFYHLLARSIAVSLSGAGIEKSEVVVNLRLRAHRRPRILVRRLLFYRDDRTQSGNLVDVRALHIAEKVACVGRESLYIPALSLSIDSVES